MGMPESDSTETNLWRISRGDHSLPESSARPTTLRKPRRMLWAVTAVWAGH
jgi:hypothetical protein